MGDGIRGEGFAFAAGFQAAFAAAAAKYFFGIRSSEGITRDVLATLDAFQKKRIFRLVREAQMRADWREQVGGESLVHRDQVTRRASFANVLKSG